MIFDNTNAFYAFYLSSIDMGLYCSLHYIVRFISFLILVAEILIAFEIVEASSRDPIWLRTTIADQARQNFWTCGAYEEHGYSH